MSALQKINEDMIVNLPKGDLHVHWHCCKVSDEAAFCLIQRPYISKTLLTRRISPRG
ncbi:short-chain dehydrogenase, partial [Acinetobacter baumannii]|nr:short-chain dehydrogenase [Acinetobacter baumannii]